MIADQIPEEELYEIMESLDEPAEEVDERWLISYADLMTLLFGLFVMLYAMIDKFEIIQDAAKKEFSTRPVTTEHQPVEEPLPKAKLEQIEFLQSERAALAAKSAKLQEEMMALRKYNLELEKKADDAAKLKEQLRQQSLELTAEAERRAYAEMMAKNAQRSAELATQENEEFRKRMAEQAAVVLPERKAAEAQYDASSIKSPPSGKGVAGGTHQNAFKFVTTLSSGRLFEAKAIKITLAGVQIDTTVPRELVSQSFKTTLTRDDGSTIDIVMLGVAGSHGEPTNRLAIVDLPANGEAILKTWISGNQ
jgi:flagellar motor protein MotB